MNYPSIKKMPFDEYLARPEMHKSRLFLLDKGVEHFLSDEPVKVTPDMILGSLAHQMFLEPADFVNGKIVEPDINKKTKAGKAAYADFLKAHKGKEIVSRSHHEKLLAMSDSMRSGRYKIAMSLLTDCEPEMSIFLEWEGISWKVRPDGLNEKKKIVTEYKTAASIPSFPNQVFRLGYDVQAALYLEAVEAYFGEEFSFIWVVQEKAPPYAVAVLDASLGNPSPLEIGQARLNNLIEKYKSLKAVDFKLPDGRFINDRIKALKVPKRAEYL